MMVSDINRKHLAAVNIVTSIENNLFLDSSQNVYFPKLLISYNFLSFQLFNLILKLFKIYMSWDFDTLCQLNSLLWDSNNKNRSALT